MEDTDKVETGEKERPVKTRIIEAIKNQDLEVLENELRNANQLLTGSEQAHFSSNSEDELREILKQLLREAKQGYASEVVYLGDGGYSRFLLGAIGDNISVDLTYNSTDRVKQKWARLQ